MMRTLVAISLVLAVMPAFAQDFSPLPNDQLVTFSLSAQSLTTQLVVDVPEGARQLSVEIDSSTAGVDIDLLLRHGSAFEFDIPDVDSLFDQSQYLSVSPGANEFVVISEASHFPVQPGRWYLTIFNFASQAAEVQVRAIVSTQALAGAPIEIDFDQPGENCNVAEWNPQRRAALENAAQRLSQTLRSTVPVRVRACWRDYGADSTTLASAIPSGFFRGFPGSARRNTFYSRPTVARQAGTPLCKFAGGSCDATDLTVTFNTRVDDPSRPATQRWHYGTGDGGVVTGFDFVSVAMHELVHGLGFVGLVDVDSGQLLGAPFDDVYAYNTIYSQLGQLPRRLTELDSDAERVTAMSSGLGLSFDAPAELNPVQQPGRLTPLPLHAPAELDPGSTLSHLRMGLNPPQLMFPSIPAGQQRRELGFSELVLNKVGWDPEPKSPPVFAPPLIGQWFDIARNGHGIEFSRVFDSWVMTMYSYDDSGHPEYYQAIGPVVDGQYLPLTTVNSNNLVRYFYDEARSPPQFADEDPNTSGRVTLDFVDPDTYPECRDGFQDQRPTEDGLSAMRWRIDSTQSRIWCMAPLLPKSLRAAPDFSGLWFAGNDDSGWGFSITNATIDDKVLLFAVLYYPDAEGRGRWVYAISDDYQPGQTLPLVQRVAYCRTCALPPGPQPWTDREVGQITLNLVQPAFFDPTAGNTVSFVIDVPDGPAAGRFERDTLDLLMLTEPVEP